MKIKKIFIKEWQSLKPYEEYSITDIYYLKLSNKFKEILFIKYIDVFESILDESDINLLSCLLASYFEDIISETNIFVAFTNKHKELYGKRLPFFDTTEYYEEEVNIQDIQFLIWYFLNTIQYVKFINPHKQEFYDIATDIIQILDEEYEYAPENQVLKKYYSLDKNESDYYIVRDVIDIVLFRSYFFHTDTKQKLLEVEQEIIEKSKNDEFLLSYLRDARDEVLFSSRTKILSLPGQEWLAEILGKKHPLYRDFLAISPKIKGYFLYKGQDKKHVFIEHIASGKKFNLTKKSFDQGYKLTKIDTIVYIGIVRWKNEWWFSGIFFPMDYNADLILDEKNSIQSRRQVDFLYSESKEITEALNQQYQIFLDFNNGKQVAFLPADQVNDFVSKYYTFYNDSLNLSKKERKEAINRAKKDGFFGGNDTKVIGKIDQDIETALVFFNPKSGLEVSFEVNSAFPVKENPYFNEEKTKEHILRLFMAKNISPELVHYCVDNYKNKLPFFKTFEGKFLLKDIDFLLRFFKEAEYHSVPQISFMGNS